MVALLLFQNPIRSSVKARHPKLTHGIVPHITAFVVTRTVSGNICLHTQAAKFRLRNLPAPARMSGKTPSPALQTNIADGERLYGANGCMMRSAIYEIADSRRVPGPRRKFQIRSILDNSCSSRYRRYDKIQLQSQRPAACVSIRAPIGSDGTVTKNRSEVLHIRAERGQLRSATATRTGLSARGEGW